MQNFIIGKWRSSKKRGKRQFQQKS